MPNVRAYDSVLSGLAKIPQAVPNAKGRARATRTDASAGLAGSALMDETTVQVLEEPGKTAQSKWYLWFDVHPNEIAQWKAHLGLTRFSGQFFA
jgi:hypothetical protein